MPASEKKERAQRKRHRHVGLGEARELADVLDHDVAAAHGEDAGEGAEGHDEVDGKVDQQPLDAGGGAGGEADEGEADVADRGIGP